MSDHPILTIITPVYNGEKYISETIESVIKSSTKYSYEYLVLDDGSTDSTLKILNNYKDKIKIFSHKNIGESATVNRGLENALGKFILVISADDPLLTNELIERACKILIENSAIVAIYPDWRIIDQNGNTLRNKILPEFTDELLIGHCKCLPGPGTIFRRDKALQIGGRRSDWKFVGDYDFWLRLSRVGKIVRLPGVLAQWRENQYSASISQRDNKMAIERIEVIEKFLLENKISEDLRRKALGNSYYLAARLAFFDHRIKGRSLLFKAFKYRRGWPEEAKLYVVLYLLLIPITSIVFKPFSKKIIRIISYK
jgi:glycosyltransferase involved in cell wall biosynthesis